MLQLSRATARRATISFRASCAGIKGLAMPKCGPACASQRASGEPQACRPAHESPPDRRDPPAAAQAHHHTGALGAEIAHLRTGLQALADKARNQEERLRHLEGRTTTTTPPAPQRQLTPISRQASLTTRPDWPDNSADNAVAEAFFSSLKRELVHRHRYPDRPTARRSIFEWLARYSTTKRHTSLDCQRPDDYEAHYRDTAVNQPALTN